MASLALGGDEEKEVRLGLERSIYEVCKRSPEGSDFLVSAFVQALHSYRRSSVLTPFPSALFTTEDDFKDKDFAAAAAAVQSFPPLQDILSCWTCHVNGLSCGQSAKDDAAGSVQCLYSVGKMSLSALKLLDWILRYRHGIAVVQDPENDLSSLFPPASSPWARYRRGVASEACAVPDYVMKIQESNEDSWRTRASTFESVKAEFGSFHAFHGTSAENLHSILRCGLLNMSNSQLQRNGCIFGEGVYLSTDPGVAHSFCKAGTGWTHSFCGSRVRYVLVCEVAGKYTFRSDSTALKTGSFAVQDYPSTCREESSTSNSVPNTYVVVKNSDLVKIRYIFVYTEPSRVQITLRSSSFGPLGILPEVLGTHGVASERYVSKLGFVDMLKKVDWCRTFIVLYIVVLIGVGLLKHNTGRYGRGSFVQRFFPVYQ
ncbi:uncharacterized protein [Physcomitrium patens]|uniref:Poly [ADP-ribose] polymerase n=1 Tax=Physcomitrium patens TaxID=3218 RepID=A0A2K1ISN8_PHYPA|nr:mono [ADP-ribose] polymerase PARP16-like [Physcomitrium patens]PNR32292.1 hypothetical protein PHYPA_026418 [Physcomitrium patens]|eukprot:XP_024359246.1 mono [ADP-ribose] polymerase PARP16-like [Physcomitrella patens]